MTVQRRGRPAVTGPAFAARRVDLAAFFGPRGESYLRHYDRRAAAGEGVPGPTALSWSWPAFGASFVWFWYRRMWGAGLIALLLPMLAGAVNGWAGMFAYGMVCLLAEECALRAGLAALAEADRQELAGEARLEWLRRRGGVSLLGGAVGVAVLLLLTAAGAMAVIAELPGIVERLDAAGLLPAQ